MAATSLTVISSRPSLENSYPGPKRSVAFVDPYRDRRVDVEQRAYDQDGNEWEESSENSELLGSNRSIPDDEYHTRWRLKDLKIPFGIGLLMAVIIFGAIYVGSGGALALSNWG